MKSRIMVVLGLALLLGVAVPAAAQLSGAIYTSTNDGTTVNGNVYPSKDAVFLNGGPPPNAPCTSGGLPDGEYYFQVTDPSGADLLSTDDIEERRVNVAGGFINNYLGTTHDVALGKCAGAISVGLIPYLDTPNAGGEYKVWITPVGAYDPPNGFHGFIPSNTKTDNFKVRRGDECTEDCDGEPEPVAIVGNKFYDTNTDGIWDNTEPPIPGWRIEKFPPEPSDVTYTATSGQYSFLVDPDSGLYTISEVPPPPGFFPAGQWINTTATSGDVTVGSEDVAGPDFGNVCLGNGNGRTLGFWSNKNGQARFNSQLAGNLALLQALNLRNANGSDFNPANYSAFRTWLLKATATNMAYMLSAQLAAMALNVNNGLVSGSSLVYAPGTNSANGAGFATISDLISEANTELGLHGLVLDGSAFRAYQEALKDALDDGNNNLNFVQSGPEACPFDTPY